MDKQELVKELVDQKQEVKNNEQTTDNTTSTTDAASSSSSSSSSYHKNFARLARMEAELRRKEKEFKEERNRHQQTLEEYERFKQVKSKAKEDPFSYLQEAELSFEDLLARILSNDANSAESGSKDNHTQALEKRLQELEEKLQQEKEESYNRELSQKQQQLMDAIDTIIDADSDKYELVKRFKKQELIFETIVEVYKETGQYRSIDEVADLIERDLEKDLEEMASIKKLQKKLLKTSPETSSKRSPSLESESEHNPFLTQRNNPFTISNNLSSSASRDSVDPSSLSPEERYKRAVEAMRKFNNK